MKKYIKCSCGRLVKEDEMISVEDNTSGGSNKMMEFITGTDTTKKPKKLILMCEKCLQEHNSRL